MTTNSKEFGRLQQQVKDMDKRLATVEEKMDKILEAINKGRGAAALAIVLLTALGAAVIEGIRWLIHH